MFVDLRLKFVSQRSFQFMIERGWILEDGTITEEFRRDFGKDFNEVAIDPIGEE